MADRDARDGSRDDVRTESRAPLWIGGALFVLGAVLEIATDGDVLGLDVGPLLAAAAAGMVGGNLGMRLRHRMRRSDGHQTEDR